MKITQTTCDSCGANLTTTGNCVDYLIILRSERIPSNDGSVTVMNIEPQIQHQLHFCGIACLKKHVEKL